ncbi:hypothetical protein [Paenibacillus thermotolerans]|uniref:hypothetical protein n=1 Tax=Paenibacillus thermotolerans TaxID=3027807 RepID=UPI002368D028|nr:MULTISPECIES: hypothetical protein [unclassified Paenibacillus]
MKKQKEEVPELIEMDNLINEKIELATRLGIWDTYDPVPNYRETKEYKRIQEIDKRLAEIG